MEKQLTTEERNVKRRYVDSFKQEYGKIVTKVFMYVVDTKEYGNHDLPEEYKDHRYKECSQEDSDAIQFPTVEELKEAIKTLHKVSTVRIPKEEKEVIKTLQGKYFKWGVYRELNKPTESARRSTIKKYQATRCLDLAGHFLRTPWDVEFDVYENRKLLCKVSLPKEIMFSRYMMWGGTPEDFAINCLDCFHEIGDQWIKEIRQSVRQAKRKPVPTPA